jgi:methyl-accepting chemotaxis protein
VAASDTKTRKRKAPSRAPAQSRRATDNGTVQIKQKDLQELLDALRSARDGDVGVRLSAQKSGVMGDVAKAFNQLAERREGLMNELYRVSKVIGREGRMTERARMKGAKGSWADSLGSVNTMIDDLVRPTIEVSRVLDAVAEGDLSQKMALKIQGQPVRGEFLRIGTTVNAMLDQLSSFASEVTRVAREVGTEGILGGQARVKGASGIWRDLTDNVNFMATNLTTQVR